ncbi:hypothetical protein TSUD_405680 [Trifolium subterraneum]|uniref:non-specific serine/threonine protein kinase n=1 Tax=Trifolium subterraneum TaxID=3900 RepID=A0A2Z6PFJ3_TRISU|nr:hypothetical protein TSUD_405680 [Trifolium subterraneum]
MKGEQVLLNVKPKCTSNRVPRKENKRAANCCFQKSINQDQLINENPVAIKKLLNNLGQAEKKFRVEVEAIGHVRHKNFVRLLGFYIEGTHRLATCTKAHKLTLDAAIAEVSDHIDITKLRLGAGAGVSTSVVSVGGGGTGATIAGVGASIGGKVTGAGAGTGVAFTATGGGGNGGEATGGGGNAGGNVGVEIGEPFGGWGSVTFGLEAGAIFGVGDVTGADLGATFAGGLLVMGADATTVGGCGLTGVVAFGGCGLTGVDATTVGGCGLTGVVAFGVVDGVVAGAWALNPSKQLRLSKVRTQNIVAITVVCELLIESLFHIYWL